MKYVLAALLVLLNLSACSGPAPLQGEVTTSNLDKSQNIVGGEDVDPSDEHIEHTVLITGKYETGETFTCTGTLIDSDIILTAAHCVGEPDSMKVVFGENPVQEGAVSITKVKNVLRHKKYNKTENIRNDIALLQVGEMVPQNFAPAILPWNSPQALDNIDKITVYGYGTTSGLVENGKLANKGVGVLRTTVLNVTTQSKSRDVFFANQREGKGICAGDSGGPAFVKDNVVLGVISRAITDDPQHPEAADNDVCNFESVFTNVKYYKTWILSGIETLHAITDAPESIVNLL